MTFPNHGRKAVYARAEFAVETAKTMMDWAKEVDGWRDLEPVELMVAMTENGYQMNVPPKQAVRQLSKKLAVVI